MHWTLGHRLCILYMLIRPVIASPVKALSRNELVEVEKVGEAFIKAGTRTFVKYIDFVGVNTQLETLLERLQAMNPSGHSRGFTKIKGQSLEFIISDRVATAADNLLKCEEQGLNPISFSSYNREKLNVHVYRESCAVSCHKPYR